MFCELCEGIVVWIPSIHINYYDPNVGIAFEKEFPNCVLWTLCKYYNLNILIHIGYCDSNVGIVFEEGKSSVCFVNFMWVLHLKRKNHVCVLWTLCGYCIWWEKIQFVFCELYVGIAFEKKNSRVCFVNSMWILHLRKKKLACVLWTLCGYCILGEKIQCVFCELHVAIVVCIPSI
jgi:hypothetical protein